MSLKTTEDYRKPHKTRKKPTQVPCIFPGLPLPMPRGTAALGPKSQATLLGPLLGLGCNFLDFFKKDKGLG